MSAAEKMGKNVCIIDDNAQMLVVMRKALEIKKYTVSIAESFKGVEEILRIAPDMIYLDVSLKGQNGCAVARELKSDTRTKDIPIIMLTGHDNAYELAAQAGADDYLSKPFDFETLWNMTEEYSSRVVSKTE